VYADRDQLRRWRRAAPSTVATIRSSPGMPAGRLLLIDGATAYGDQKAGSISGLESTDDYTIRMTLEAPDSTWLLTLGDFRRYGHPTGARAARRGAGPAEVASVQPQSVGSAGVFQFGKWETDQYLEIRRNDAYGGGDRATLDSVFFKTPPRDVAHRQRLAYPGS
jgi:ABC-type transport system substrate-binding protein